MPGACDDVNVKNFNLLSCLKIICFWPVYKIKEIRFHKMTKEQKFEHKLLHITPPNSLTIMDNA